MRTKERQSNLSTTAVMGLTVCFLAQTTFKTSWFRSDRGCWKDRKGRGILSELTHEELIGPDAAQDEELEAGIKLAAHDLFLRLQGTFSPPAYITLEEVRDATGFDGHRTADAIAVSLYRSRGKAIWGFEMKVSRSDWLHELKQPEKSESIMRYCNYWALVVPNKDIVKPGE